MRYVVFLRAISNVRMDPFRKGMEALGFRDVASYGMSGNLVFTADRSARRSLEVRIAARFGTDAFVRSKAELSRTIEEDPFESSVLFLASIPSATARSGFERLEFESRRPVLRGSVLYFVYPARLRGTRSPFDFERALEVRATARSSRVVARIHARMTRNVAS